MGRLGNCVVGGIDANQARSCSLTIGEYAEMQAILSDGLNSFRSCCDRSAL